MKLHEGGKWRLRNGEIVEGLKCMGEKWIRWVYQKSPGLLKTWTDEGLYYKYSPLSEYDIVEEIKEEKEERSMQVIERVADVNGRMYIGWINEGKPNTNHAIVTVEIPEGYRLTQNGEVLTPGYMFFNGDRFLSGDMYDGMAGDPFRVYIVRQEPKLTVLLDGKEVSLTEDQAKLIRQGVQA